MDHNSHYAVGLSLIVQLAIGIDRTFSSATRLGPTSELLVTLVVVGLIVSAALVIASWTRGSSRLRLMETDGAVKE